MNPAGKAIQHRGCLVRSTCDRLYKRMFQMHSQGAGAASSCQQPSLVHMALTNQQETQQYQQLLLSALLLVVDTVGTCLNGIVAGSLWSQSVGWQHSWRKSLI